MSADPELDRLEKERVALYEKLSRHNVKAAAIRVQIYEIEDRIAAILRGDR